MFTVAEVEPLLDEIDRLRDVLIQIAHGAIGKHSASLVAQAAVLDQS